jgi:hypothetical protein
MRANYSKLEGQVRDIKQLVVTLQKTNAMLEQKLAGVEEERDEERGKRAPDPEHLRSIDSKFTKLQAQLSDHERMLANLSKSTARIAAKDAADGDHGLAAERARTESEVDSLRRKMEEMRGEIGRQSSDIGSIRNANIALEKRVDSSQEQFRTLLSQIGENNNRLGNMEGSIDRLSRLMERRVQEDPRARYFGDPSLAERGTSESYDRTVAYPQVERANREMMVATVSVPRAYLRSGPGTDESAMGIVPRGSRLVVETRQGEWYRIIAPDGDRAWISAQVVDFGADGHSAPTDTVRVHGYDGHIEADENR